jgi:hypothetical protein
VAKKTGLSLAAVLAWVQAENGPNHNYLGIMVPGTQTLESYPTPEAAAAATVATLHEPRYASVLSTASQTNDPKVELAAIASSPWDTGKAGPKPAYLQLLLGALTSNSNNPGLATVPGSGDTAPSLSADFGGMFGGLEKWLQQESALALSYIVLVILGLAFVIFGALDTFGYSPGRVAGAVTKPPVPDAIPF